MNDGYGGVSYGCSWKTTEAPVWDYTNISASATGLCTYVEADNTHSNKKDYCTAQNN